jgi:hypothetical protein
MTCVFCFQAAFIDLTNPATKLRKLPGIFDEREVMTNSSVMNYAVKDQSYFNGERSDFIDRIPSGRNLRFLEIGCGDGEVGFFNSCDSSVGATSRWRRCLIQVDVVACVNRSNPRTPDRNHSCSFVGCDVHHRRPAPVVLRICKLAT